MTTIGYAAMLEQFHPTDLLDWCAQAEAAGFEAGFMVSEHFHPWTPQQGQSAFAWAFMGALGQRTSLKFGTAVTCPGFRYHPAVIAHAAATIGAMYPGRFYLGLGAGEALNEHVVGGVWPEIGIRSAMMFESIEIINKLFTGKVVKHKGEFFTLESAKLYTRPEEPVPVYVATAGPDQREEDRQVRRRDHHRGRGGREDRMLWEKYEEGAREAGKEPATSPKILQIHVSWARTDEEAVDERDGRMAERRHAVPEAGHQEPRGLRRDGEAGQARGLHEPGADDQRPRGPHRAHPALRRHGLRRGPSPQRRPRTRPTSSRSSARRSCRTCAWAEASDPQDGDPSAGR